MKELDYEKYFENNEKKYYNSKILITILEDILNKDMDTIKSEVFNAEVIVTGEQIKEYLNNKFVEENLDVKERLKKSSSIDISSQDLSARLQDIKDQVIASRYYFEPYSLEYFDKYVNIVKNKVILLLSIILKIANKKHSSIKDMMNELDIVLDNDGNILKEDVIRLIAPTIYNINILNDKVTKANDLSTYLTFKETREALYQDGMFEYDSYPTIAIQVKNLCYAHLCGNVPLSDNQKNELHEEELKKMIYIK